MTSTNMLHLLLLAGLLGNAVSQEEIEPNNVVIAERLEILQCLGDIALAESGNQRSFRTYDDDDWDYTKLLNGNEIGFRTTSDVVDESGDCTAYREEQLVQDDSVAQASDASIRMEAAPGTSRSKIIDKNPVGFAMEYGFLNIISQTPPDPRLLNLFDLLYTKDSGPGLAIGGNTGMLARLNNSAYPAVFTAVVNVTAEDFQAVNSFAYYAKTPLTMSVPMLTRQPGPSIEFLNRGILSYINPNLIEAVEIGNEPDHWQIEKKCYRSGNYTFNDYLAEYQTYEQAITQYIMSTNITLQAPAIAGCNSFPEGLLPCYQTDLPTFASQTSNYTKVLSWHRYGNSGCSVKSNLRTLLADPVDDGTIKSFAWLEKVTPEVTKQNKTLTCSESGAFSCGGLECISGTFATTLWGVDYILEVLYRNSSRVAFHTVPDHIYSPFHIYNSSGLAIPDSELDESLLIEDDESAVNNAAEETTVKSAAKKLTSSLKVKTEERRGLGSEIHRISRRERFVYRRQADQTATAVAVEQVTAQSTVAGTDIAQTTTFGATADAVTTTFGTVDGATTYGDYGSGATTAGAVDNVVDTAAATVVSSQAVAAIVSTSATAETSETNSPALAQTTPASVAVVSTPSVENTSSSSSVTPVVVPVVAGTTEAVTTDDSGALGVVAVTTADSVVNPQTAEEAVATIQAVETSSPAVVATQPDSDIVLSSTEDAGAAANTVAAAVAVSEVATTDAQIVGTTIADVLTAGTTEADTGIVATATAAVVPITDSVVVTTTATAATTAVAVEPSGTYETVPPANTSDRIIRANPIFFAMWQIVKLVDDMEDAYVFKPNITINGYENNTNIKVWGVGGSNQKTKIVIIHKDVDQLSSLPIAIDGNFTQRANISRLVSDGVLTSTAYLAGQSIAEDGVPRGDIVTESIPSSNGKYELTVDQMTVVVVEIPEFAPLSESLEQESATVAATAV